MSDKLKNGKDKYGIIRPGAKLNEIFDKGLVLLLVVGIPAATVMVGLIYS